MEHPLSEIKILVLDDWVLHDLNGENGQPALQETLQFLRKFRRENCYQTLALMRGTSWMQKAHHLMTDPRFREQSQYLHLEILRDSSKCQLLDPSSVSPIPGELRDKIPEEDFYLIETYLHAQADLLVTPDKGLYDAIVSLDSYNINVVTKDDFLEQYLA